MFNKKIGLVVVMVLTMSIVLAGCFNSGTQPTQVPDETLVPSTTMVPEATLTPGATIAPDAPAMPFDWNAQGAAVEGRINMFSEIAESVVVTSEQTALVGVRFTSTYKGEMTQRIKDMISGEVMAADTGITVVAVTADPADFAKIQELAQKKATGATDAEIKPEVDQIVKNVGTMR